MGMEVLTAGHAVGSGGQNPPSAPHFPAWLSGDSDTQRHHEVHPSFPAVSLVPELIAAKPGWIFWLFAGQCWVE